jgi:hypothetical protein
MVAIIRRSHAGCAASDLSADSLAARVAGDTVSCDGCGSTDFGGSGSAWLGGAITDKQSAAASVITTHDID